MSTKTKKILILSALIFVFLFTAVNVTTTIIVRNKNFSLRAAHESGVSGSIVYLNDLNADYNYYMGRNYTYSSDGKIPTSENKNIYNDTNLVKMTITYKGQDPTGGGTGTVSISETQNTYIYYKYFPVNNNGTPSNKNDDYINLELIDNPFTNRPTDKGFNGWNTDYVGATVYLDKEIYTRYAKIPVTYNGSNPNDIDITFYADWINATVANLTETNSGGIIGGIISEDKMEAAVDDLQSAGMKPLYTTTTYLAQNYLINGGQIILGQNYPSGAVNINNGSLSGRCTRTLIQGGCPYYYYRAQGTVYDSGLTYYNIGSSSSVTPNTYNKYYYTQISVGSNLGSIYKEVSISANGNCSGLYNSSGTLQTSTSCSAGTYYELQQYLKSDGTQNTAPSNLEDLQYDYLVTRDTNILVVRVNWTDEVGNVLTKPLTLTSAYNGTNYGNYIQLSGTLGLGGTYIKAQTDLTIENIQLRTTSNPSDSSSPSSGTTSSNTIYANYKNLKIGRGITSNGSYETAGSFIGGNNSTSGSASSPTRYRVIVESGNYAVGTATNSGGTSNLYLDGTLIFGSDYDRAKNDNTKLTFYNCLAGMYGGKIYSKDSSTISVTQIIKSGTFGSAKSDSTHGIYVGGRGTTGAQIQSPMRLIVEGGDIYNINGGPLAVETRAEYNHIYAFIKGGTVETIFGGAATTATYGNRIIQVSGGTISHSILGGSNAYDGSGTDGTLNGDTYIYVGGNANLNGATSAKYNVETGSVFGAGAGRSNSNTIGTVNNSTIIIDPSATISGNVYGGGNYAAVGIQNVSSTKTTIKINGGTIGGSVYGGGNNNGSGSSSIPSTIDIDMTGGTISGSLYGGSNVKGTIYGDTDIDVTGGVITNSVYGGGLGGYTSTSAPGTFVSGNVDVTIGNSDGGPSIGEDVYGGSSFGSVNTSTNSTTYTNTTTKVTVNNGTVAGSVYGGGKGSDTYTANVDGDITVTVNGGNIGNVFGGNNVKGTPSGDIDVLVTGGTIGNVYGGGNDTPSNTTSVTTTGGTIGNVYGGGNNGDVTTTSVTMTDTTVNYSVYGGGNNADVTNAIPTTITSSTIGDDVYGGGNAGKVNGNTTVIISDTDIGRNAVAGGKGATATVTGDTSITINNNSTVGGNVYGGGDAGEVTGKSTTTITSSEVTGSVYGGGNQANIGGTSTVTITSSEIGTDLYGGGNAGATGGNVTVEVSSSTVGGDAVAGGKGSTASVPGNTSITVSNNSTISGNLIGGGNAGAVSGTATTTLTSSTVEGDIYGGGNQSAVTGKINVTTEDSTVNGDIYGGGNAGISQNDVTVHISSTEVDGSAYAGGKGSSATVNGNVEITVDDNSKINTNLVGGGNAGRVNGTATTTLTSSEVGGDLFGGGNQAVVTGNIIVTATDSTVTGNMFGGGNAGASEGTTTITIDNTTIGVDLYGGGNQADVAGTATITATDSTIGANIYGGGNAGTVGGDATIDLDHVTINGNLFGGGNGGTATVNGSTDIKFTNGSSVSNNLFGGGNAAPITGDSTVYISNSRVGGSAYAGGNGATAVVPGNTKITIDGTSTITRNVFGGGNAAFTGTESADNSTSIVNIAGGKIGGNVYGGANTSKIYGTAEVNIGYNAVNDSSLIREDIEIDGTVFGGGEANASGSESYDFDFISVTKGIEINIDGSGHDKIDLYGSIFGSGNASSAAGTSNIYIKNYGTNSDVKKNVSIQRADLVKLDNSKIELSGATDRTNEYSSVKFSISRVKDFQLTNNSEIYVEAGTNLLEHFESLTSTGEKASVSIVENGATISRNVDNRVYALEGINVNVSHVQQVTNNGDQAGDVDGMSFFGMYAHDRNGNIVKGIYDTNNFTFGDSVTYDEYYFFPTGSYVSGKHKTNHDITADGFYTNFAVGDDDTSTTIQVNYINPTPVDQPFYNWIVGSAADEYEVNLVASKYLSLGSTEVPFTSHNTSNSIFTVIGVNFEELDESINLVDETEIPRIAETDEEANTNMGLSIKSGSSGWVTNGQTNFYNDADEEITGTTEYVRDNTSTIPSLALYLYHSKNITEAGDLGSVTITFIVTIPTDGISSTIRRVKLKVNLSRVLYSTAEYESSITPGKRYSMFPMTTTNISTKSSFSTYFSFFTTKNTTPYDEGDYRTLISSYNYPVNTKITMIDFANPDEPEYYYLIIDNTIYNAKQTELANNGEATYDFSLFGTMGVEGSNSYYDDETKNVEYYNTTSKYANEEYIFIVDFSESGIDSDVEDNSILMELRSEEDRTKVGVLGTLQEQMIYNIYKVSDTIELSGELGKTNIYPGTQVDLDLSTEVSTSVVGSKSVYNSEFNENKMGVKITILDDEGNPVSGTSLLGLSFEYDDKTYYPRMDGTTRINISPRVANVAAAIKMNVPDTMADGSYTMVIDSFASPDGIYSGLYYLDRIQIPMTVLNTTYGLKVDIEDEMVIINKTTGKTLKDNNVLRLDFSCESYLTKANITIELQRRKYDSAYSLEYETVDLADYVSNKLTATSTENEYLLFNVPITQINLSYNMKEDLVSGTYRIVFRIYDETEFIGDVYKYIVIK